jgi:hypothetical protein
VSASLKPVVIEFSEFFICVEWFVDPDLGWNRGWFWCLADEAFGMEAIGGIENGLALFADDRGLVVESSLASRH